MHVTAIHLGSSSNINLGHAVTLILTYKKKKAIFKREGRTPGEFLESGSDQEFDMVASEQQFYQLIPETTLVDRRPLKDEAAEAIEGMPKVL